MPNPTLVCLLPARNAAADLPGWFQSVERFADAVVALDDGSTDETPDLLRAHPLTRALLRNPERADYRGWDDAANRARLLTAAADLRPDWIVWLDADERVDDQDGTALRHFALHEADPDCAYLFRVFRMIGADGSWDENHLWVGRMFAFRPGQRLPEGTLHFVPIPTDIPRSLWIRTTIRIQHFASSTAERRRKRYAKYQETDPHRRWQHSYADLLAEPRRLNLWAHRPPGLPVVEHGPSFPEAPPEDALVLSVVVISRDDEDRIRGVLDALCTQASPAAFEVIVVTSGTDRTAAIVRQEYPQVELVELKEPALPGGARNAGLASARGRHVAFPGSHVRSQPGYVARCIEHHLAGWCVVTGSFTNGTPSMAGWANYFLDHSAKLPARPAGPLTVHPAGTCSYRRDVLEWVGGFPDIRAGEDTLVNSAIFDAGYGAFFDPEVRLVHDTPCDTTARLLRHHWGRGRGFTELLLSEHEAGRLFTKQGLRSRLIGFAPGRLRRIHRNVFLWGSRYERRQLILSLPLMIAAVLAHFVSGWLGLARSLARRRDH